VLYSEETPIPREKIEHFGKLHHICKLSFFDSFISDDFHDQVMVESEVTYVVS
jgi:hypothetical protein